MLLSGSHIIGQRFPFRHNNDSKQKTKVYRELLEDRRVTGALVIKSLQTHDLSPIVLLLRQELGRRAEPRQPQPAQQLWQN